MKCAILLPGPSLKDAWRGGDYDHVVAVTAAIHAEPRCDIWALAENPAHAHQGRYRLFAERFFEVNPTIWTLSGLAQRWHKHWEVPKDHPIVEKGIQQLMASLGWPMKHRWAERIPNGHSFFRALFGALDAGATSIDIYGHDMEGQADYNPATGDAIANAKEEGFWSARWEQERTLWQEVSLTMTQQKVTLRENPTGTSSQPDPVASSSEQETSSTDRLSQSIARSESEIERLLTSGLVGTTPRDSLKSESTPTSILPSSFGSAPSDSKSS